LKSAKVKEIVGQTEEHRTGMSSEVGGNHQVAGVEDPFDDSERPFDQQSDSADSAISAFIFRGDRMTPSGSSHGLVH
jgi:hypothetical protein